MATITHGSITLTVPNELAPPAEAGKMSADEVLHLSKAPHGIGLACQHAADSMTKAGASFTPPAGVTPASLVAAGQRAEGMDEVIVDHSVIMTILKQANLLFDKDAWEQLRKVNDMVKAQAKHDPQLKVIFKPLLDFVAENHSHHHSSAEQPAPQGTAPAPGTQPVQSTTPANVKP